MHQLADLRYYQSSNLYGRWGGVPRQLGVYEVDANGSPHTLVRIELHSEEVVGSSPYRCECGCEFGSWEEAHGHIEPDGQERT